MKIDLKMILIAGAIYWFLFRDKVNSDFNRVSGGGVSTGDGYP